jgi:hypothetical protein
VDTSTKRYSTVDIPFLFSEANSRGLEYDRSEMKKLIKSNTSAGEKPFLADAYEAGIVVDGEVLPILLIRESRSRKGYLITTEVALVYLYKSSGWVEPLLEQVTSFCESQHGFEVVIVVDVDEENGIHIEVDEQIPRIWNYVKKLGNGVVMTCLQDISGNSKKTLTRRERSKATQ